LSYVLQIIEDDLIMNASNKLKQLNYVVDTLCFDGLLVNATNLSSELLGELSSYCYECSGYKVEFSFKPMEKHYECVDEEFDVSGYEYKHLDEYEQRYCGTLEGGCSEETYQIRKGYLEHFLCKVQQPEPMYVFTNGKHKNLNYCPLLNVVCC